MYEQSARYRTPCMRCACYHGKDGHVRELRLAGSADPCRSRCSAMCMWRYHTYLHDLRSQDYKNIISAWGSNGCPETGGSFFPIPSILSVAARFSRSSNKWIFNSRERRDPWRWHLLIYDFRLRVQNIYPHDHSRSPCTTLPTTPQIMFPGMGHPGTDLRYHTGISWASNMRRKKSTINIRHFVNSWKWSCQFWFTGSWATQQHLQSLFKHTTSDHTLGAQSTTRGQASGTTRSWNCLCKESEPCSQMCCLN